ncbi:MAG: zinc-ribbon domain-containing protein [Alphaproteobacteria bacterium]|nr:zinc-ribbon domain-containing protein [Alphaproteobacteria bacterium]
MILSCPSCAAQFNINPQALGEAGRTVRCGKCKHQWHATAPLITLQADDLNGAKTSGVSKAAPASPPESAGISEKSVGQHAIAGSTEPAAQEPPVKAPPVKEALAKSSFKQTSYAQAAMDDEDALLSSMSSLPSYSSEMAPIARRNAIIAAVLLASLLSIPIFMLNHGASPEQSSVVKTDDKKPEEIKPVEKVEAKKEDREIILDGTPTTLLKEEVGSTILSIEGALINKTQKVLPVPILQAQALNAKGKVVKEWIIPIPNKEMNPGERQPFSYSMPFSEQGVVDIAFHFL